MQLSAVVIFD